MLPGAGAVVWIVRRCELNAAEAAGLAFSLSVAALSVVSTVVWLAGGGLEAVTASWTLLAAAGAAASVVGIRRRVPGEARRPRFDGGWSGLVLAAGAGVVAMVQRPWFFTSSDIFYHVAAVRSLVRSGAVFVTDPIYGSSGSLIDPTSGVWHTIQAAFARPLHIEPTTLFLSVMGVGTFVLVACVWALMRRVSGNDRVADAMTLVLLVFSYGMDLRSGGYPNEVSFGTALLFASLLALCMERRNGTYAYLAGAVGFATVTMHLGSAEFVGVTAVVFTAWTLVASFASRHSPDPVPVRAAVWPLAGLAIAFVPALPVLLPRFRALQGSLVIGQEMARLIAREVITLPGGSRIMVPGHWLGPAPLFWLGVATCAWALWRTITGKDRRALGALSVASLPAVVLSDPLVTPAIIAYSAHMARRLAKLFQFAPYVGVAWAAGTLLEDRPAGRRALLAAASAIAAVTLVCAMLFGYVPRSWPTRWTSDVGVLSAWSRDRRAYWGADTLARVRTALSGSGVPLVAGPPEPVYQLTGMADVWALSVVEAHSPYHVEATSGPVRRADAALLVDPSTPEDQRAAIAAKWGVDFVVFDDTATYLPTKTAMLADPARFAAVVVTDRITLLRVVR
jgi:hypothetical protein